MNETSDAPEFTVERQFSAPRELVWKCWTEADRLARWWGNNQFPWVSGTLDLRVGGMFLYCWRRPDGGDLWAKFVYREIVAPERLVFVTSSADKDGATMPSPWFPVFPREVLNTLTLTETAGKTHMALHAKPINATAEEIAKFAAVQPGMNMGFRAVFDQLEQLLAQG